MRGGCLLPEEICQIPQISVCRQTYLASAPMIPFMGSALLRMGVAGAPFDDRADS
jgi:hypothetical protein